MIKCPYCCIMAGSTIMDVTFGFILNEVTIEHDLFITLYININKLCTETVDIVVTTLHV